VTTEDDFQAALDKRPSDWQTRLVLADWLQERGDPRAEGYRALGVQRLHPLTATQAFDPWEGRTAWIFGHPKSYQCPRTGRLPSDWFKRVAKNEGSDQWWRRYLSRRECEDAVARAFARLPAARRAELLAPPALEAPKKRRKSAAKKPRAKGQKKGK
jgi:uncharacterized protein (TIGR02996 family)